MALGLLLVLHVLASCAPLLDAGPRKTGRSRRNVVLISWDTLRADHLGCYGYFRNTSPRVDMLASRGTRFADVSSTSAWTTPAHGTLFTSRYPTQLGSTRYMGTGRAKPLRPEEETLAEILAEAGYETQAFTGGGFISSTLGFEQGFARYRDYASLKGYIDELLGWMGSYRSRRPFFLFVHFYDTHRPYIAPDEKYRKMFSGGYAGDFPVRKVCDTSLWPIGDEDLGYIVSQYDGEIAHADDLLGSFFDRLDELDLARNTLVVFTSDHGEQFFEHGDCDHTTNVYQELIGIPLVLAGPGIPAGRVVDSPASLVDVAPTILDYLGMDVPETMLGTSLMPVVHGDAEPCGYQFFETSFWKASNDIRGVREGPWKMIFNYRDTAVEGYDLEIDPLEKTNIQPEMPARTRAALIVAYKKWRREMKKKIEMPAQTVTPGKELQDQLEALGYVRGE